MKSILLCEYQVNPISVQTHARAHTCTHTQGETQNSHKAPSCSTMKSALDLQCLAKLEKMAGKAKGGRHKGA